MAWANLGRSRGKTAVTVLSLSLAVVLLTVTVNFTGGFDMDKYVSNFTASDFIVANAGKFQTSILDFTADMAVPQSAMDDIDAQGGVTDSGVVYGQTFGALEYVTEDWFRQNKERFYTPEQLDNLIRLTDRNEAGLLADRIQLSGMSPFALDHLTVLEGDLANSMSRAAGMWPPCTPRTTTATPTWTPTGPGWGTPSPCGMWRRREYLRPGHRHRLCQRGGRARRGQLGGAAGEVPGRGLHGGRPGDGALRPLLPLLRRGRVHPERPDLYPGQRHVGRDVLRL